MLASLLEDESIRRRYNNDPVYHASVNSMLALLERGMVTTHELAQAAVLACQMYAERHMAPITVTLGDGRAATLTCTLSARENKP